MSKSNLRSIVLDAVSWADDSASELPWGKLKKELLDPLGDLDICLLVTPDQYDTTPRSFDKLYKVTQVLDSSLRIEVLEHYKSQGGLIISATPTQPYDRWLAAELDEDSPMGIRVAPEDGLQNYFSEGLVVSIPNVENNLEEVLLELDSSLDENPTQLLKHFPLPDSIHTYHSTILKLADIQEAESLHTTLLERFSELDIFGDIPELEQEKQAHAFSMRVRQCWAGALGVRATSLPKERELHQSSFLQSVLGVVPLEVTQQELDYHRDSRLFDYYSETKAYRVRDTLHVFNPTESMKDRLSGESNVSFYSGKTHSFPLAHMREALKQWTLDHYRADPLLNTLIKPFQPSEGEFPLYQYARAYLTRVECFPPQPVPAFQKKWQAILLKLLRQSLPKVKILLSGHPRESYGMDLDSKYPRHRIVAKEHLQVTFTDSSELSSLDFCPAPQLFVVVERDKNYIRLNFDMEYFSFSDLDDYDIGGFAQQSYEINRIENPEENGPYYQVSERFHRLGFPQGSVLMPTQQNVGSEILLGYVQATNAFRELIQSLPEGKDTFFSREKATQLQEKATQIASCVGGLESKTVRVPSVQYSDVGFDVDWSELDYKVGLVWLALQQAIVSPRAVQLPDHRILLQVSQGIFAEIAVRPLADGVELPFGVFVYMDEPGYNPYGYGIQDHEEIRLVLEESYYTVCKTKTIYGNSSYSTQIELPPPIQIVGNGHVIEIRFDSSPLLQAVPSTMYTQAASAPVVVEETKQQELEYQRQLEAEEERRRQEEEDDLWD